MPTGAEGCAKLSRSNLVTAMFLSNVDPTYFIYKMCGHWTRSFDEVWKFKSSEKITSVSQELWQSYLCFAPKMEGPLARECWSSIYDFVQDTFLACLSTSPQILSLSTPGDSGKHPGASRSVVSTSSWLGNRQSEEDVPGWGESDWTEVHGPQTQQI